MNPTASLTRHPAGIATVDARYLCEGFASIHVVERQGRALVVDAGTQHSVVEVLAALDQLGIERSAVEVLFVTHVHLDHAGGAGYLARQLPGARVVAHPRAVPHLRDPTRLAAAAAAVYGQATFERLYGTLEPIAAERLHASRDGELLSLGTSRLEVLHTPGHALHHHALYDRDADAAFTGDTFGLSYRATDTDRGAFILPTTTPTQFDPEQLVSSVRRIAALRPEAVYLTHYGRVTGVPRLAQSLESQIERFVEIAEEHAEAEAPQRLIRDDMATLYRELLGQHGLPLRADGVEQLLGKDLTLNAQGLVSWLQRRARAR